MLTNQPAPDPMKIKGVAVTVKLGGKPPGALPSDLAWGHKSARQTEKTPQEKSCDTIGPDTGIASAG